MSQEIYKRAVIALFEGRCTPLQKALITKFLSEPANQEFYFQWLEEWETTNPQLITDVEGAYQQFLSR
jgi:transmembrane sensor